MKTFEQIQSLQSYLSDLRSADRTIGFVPTMGALHQGHLSLLKSAKMKCDVVVVSIFVNPTQFNDQGDFDTYPRELARDRSALESNGCDVLFHPSREEMYPKEHKESFDFGRLTNVLEASFRPGHFDGMATIVKQLIGIVKPDAAFFGEKDFQQLAIIRRLAEQEKFQTEIIGCPIVREDNGLAMSSRNERLTEEQKEIAANISRVLFAMQEKIGETPPQQLAEWGREQLESVDGLRLEYLEIVDRKTFEKAENWNTTGGTVVLVAAHVGNVRLIDNLKLSKVGQGRAEAEKL